MINVGDSVGFTVSMLGVFVGFVVDEVGVFVGD